MIYVTNQHLSHCKEILQYSNKFIQIFALEKISASFFYAQEKDTFLLALQPNLNIV